MPLATPYATIAAFAEMREEIAELRAKFDTLSITTQTAGAVGRNIVYSPDWEKTESNEEMRRLFGAKLEGTGA